MALSTSVHDLRTLIRSCHPIIVIETVEEERVLTLLQSVAAQERMPLFEWSITRGLTRHDDGPTLSKMTATPLAVLQHLNGLTVEAIFWLKDLAPHLQDAAVARQMREVAAVYGRSRPPAYSPAIPLPSRGYRTDRGSPRSAAARYRRTPVHAQQRPSIARVENAASSATIHHRRAKPPQLHDRVAQLGSNPPA